MHPQMHFAGPMHLPGQAGLHFPQHSPGQLSGPFDPSGPLSGDMGLSMMGAPGPGGLQRPIPMLDWNRIAAQQPNGQAGFLPSRMPPQPQGW